MGWTRRYLCGGGNGQPGTIIYSTEEWIVLLKKHEPAFEADKIVKMLMRFFLMQGDGLHDLYVASGGYHNYAADDAYCRTGYI